ncbi:MAG: DUF1553 domain-containing protein [Bryobacterales bacterium]|nr:DUF1553 domain-containing protein [Bryobacterales bacterium]
MAIAVALCASLLIGSAISIAAPPSFPEDVHPILEANCLPCHGGDTPQQGLDLRTVPSLLTGGSSGPAIEIGSSQRSLLVDRIVAGTMPPGDSRLADSEIDVIRRWIDEGAAPEAAGLGAELVTDREVLPIFQARCVVCHGKREQRGGLDLRTRAARMAGGDSGPALVPGRPDESLIMRRVEAGEMPPPDMQYEYAVRNPTDVEVETLRKWVAAGAPPAPEVRESRKSVRRMTEAERNHWAFLPPQRPVVPAVGDQDSVSNPVDAFLLRKLEGMGLAYSEAAAPLTLLRRAYLDLTGMPPPPEEIQRYLQDDPGLRYGHLIDRLLDSPEYGERWARHWLDVAGHIDTEGFGAFAPVRENAWRYRDYVIRAFIQDKPFDEFLTEQIAGDELAPWKEREATPELIERLAATGFLRTAPDPTWEIEFAFLGERMNLIADEIHILASGVLGLTVGCARCHDHKFDPITQREYYALGAILQSAYDPYDWVQPKKRMLSVGLPSEKKEVEAFNAPLQTRIERLEESLEEAAAPYRARLLEERLARLPEAVREDLRTLSDTAEDERSEIQKYLAGKFRQTLAISHRALVERFEPYRSAAEPLQKQLKEARAKLRPVPGVRALVDMGGEPSTSYLLLRGDAFTPGEPVEPGVPAVLSTHLDPYEAVAPWPGADSSGRRLALARWLAQPGHPLTARVMVNRVWMRHFGRGIVGSPDDLGRKGDPPSHPELLDWLATEFVRSGWSVKHMHRLMMTSTAYRQASRKSEETLAADPDNVMLSRMPMRRMDAEQLYDSILMATGRLDPARFGPPAELEESDDGELHSAGSAEGYRRSIYTLRKPRAPISLLEAFDQPQMTPNCIVRSQSNVPTQALHLMNGEWTWKLSRYMAGRIIDAAGGGEDRQVSAVFLRALSRPPTEYELSESLAALSEFRSHWPERLKANRSESPVEGTARWLALANLCHTILNSAEFAFID